MSTTIHSADPATLTNASTSEKNYKTKTEKMTEAVSEKAKAAQDTVVKAAEDTYSTAQDAAQELRQNLVKAGDKAREAAEKQPLMAMAGALTVGVLIGLALNRNRY